MEDWKDKLAALAQDLPVEKEEQPESEQQPTQDIGIQRETLHVVIDRKGRKGKTATIIEGFTIADDEIEKIASELKQKIGVGGSARGGEILLQGECREKTISILKQKGFKVK